MEIKTYEDFKKYDNKETFLIRPAVRYSRRKGDDTPPTLYYEIIRIYLEMCESYWGEHPYSDSYDIYEANVKERYNLVYGGLGRIDTIKVTEAEPFDENYRHIFAEMSEAREYIKEHPLAEELKKEGK